MSRIGKLFSRFRATPREDRTEEPPAARWLIVGLGNPGAKYAASRHNLGFRVVGELADRARVELGKRKFSADYGEATIGGAPAFLVQSQTYYNRTGEAVSSLLNYYKIPLERLIVAHDELDLEPRRLRIKSGGGTAGNNGVASIAESLGTGSFIRVRIGVGTPGEPGQTIDWLVSPMKSSELKTFEPVIKRAAEAIEALVSEGLSRAMGRFNQKIDSDGD